MPNPQPTQMEQRMERYPHELRISFDGGKPVRAIIEGVEFLPAALPTADLGDDGELVERLRRAEAYIRIANRSSLHADAVEQAADRLILYGEALEQAAVDLRFAKRELLREENKEAARYMERGLNTVMAALSQARQEGDK